MIGSVSEISGVVPAHTTMNRTSSLENRWDHNGLHCFAGVFVMVLLGTVFTFRLGIFFPFHLVPALLDFEPATPETQHWHTVSPQC